MVEDCMSPSLFYSDFKSYGLTRSYTIIVIIQFFLMVFINKHLCSKPKIWSPNIHGMFYIVQQIMCMLLLKKRNEITTIITNESILSSTNAEKIFTFLFSHRNFIK